MRHFYGNSLELMSISGGHIVIVIQLKNSSKLIGDNHKMAATSIMLKVSIPHLEFEYRSRFPALSEAPFAQIKQV